MKTNKEIVWDRLKKVDKPVASPFFYCPYIPMLNQTIGRALRHKEDSQTIQVTIFK